MRKTDFTKALTEYFSIYLPTTCGVSPNTTNSYRDTFKQLLLFFQEKKGISANYIELRYLNMELVSEFLDWLETSRHIAVTTRNQRLAAIKAFAHFVQYKFRENIENCVDIINLRPKKYEKALIPFLTEDDLSLLLSQPDASTRQGLRDLTLLALLYDSGARVQELVDLRLKDVRLTHPPMVILTGKGRKVRQVPLMKDTCKLLDRYIRSFHSDSQSQMILIRGFIGCFRGCDTVGIAFGFCFLRCRLFRRCDHNRSCAVLRQCPIGEHTAAHHRRHAKGCNALPHFEFVIHCTQVLSLSKFIYIKTAPVGTDAGKPIKSPGIAAGKSYYTNCHLVGKVAEKLRKFCFRQCFHDSQRHVLRATDCRQELPRIDFAYAGTADITDHPFFA